MLSDDIIIVYHQIHSFFDNYTHLRGSNFSNCKNILPYITCVLTIVLIILILALMTLLRRNCGNKI